MRILVTGGAGYVGSVLVHELLGRGHTVEVIDNFMYRQTSLNHLCHNSRLIITVGDCRDKRVLNPSMARCDAVIPLAAIVGAPACDRDQLAATSTNEEHVSNICSMRSADQRIVIPITNSGYGIGEPGVECTEETPMRPISHYGRTKVAAESAVLSTPNSVSLRLATVFGMSPRMRLDLLVNDFVRRAMTDRALVLFEGHFKRNYVHVRDVARAFILALQNREMEGAYNVGLTSANLSKIELCQKIQEHIPAFTWIEAPIGEDPDKRDYIVSNAKIEAAGWRPRWTLDDGIVELIKGLQMLRTDVHGNA